MRAKDAHLGTGLRPEFGGESTGLWTKNGEKQHQKRLKVTKNRGSCLPMSIWDILLSISFTRCYSLDEAKRLAISGGVPPWAWFEGGFGRKPTRQTRREAGVGMSPLCTCKALFSAAGRRAKGARRVAYLCKYINMLICFYADDGGHTGRDVSSVEDAGCGARHDRAPDFFGRGGTGTAAETEAGGEVSGPGDSVQTARNLASDERADR